MATQPAAPIPDRLPWNPDLQARFVQTSLGGVALAEAGSGPPLLLVHGFGDEMVTWRHQIRALAPEAHLIALDLLGYGYSEKPATDYTPALFVETLREVLDALRIDRVSIAGNGMGGAAALGLAVRYPERVERLALLAPSTPGALPAGRFFDAFFRLVRWPWLAKRIVSAAPRWLVRLAVDECTAKPLLVDDATVDLYYATARQPGFSHAVVSTALHWRQWTEFRPRMAALEQPTLILWGERDRIQPLRQAGLLRTLIPQARFTALPCGHLPQLERAEDVAAALSAFLREGVRRPSSQAPS